eukprot:scaffold97747_cov105-Phaeocystis_antarctica.AAC.1
MAPPPHERSADDPARRDTLGRTPGEWESGRAPGTSRRYDHSVAQAATDRAYLKTSHPPAPYTSGGGDTAPAPRSRGWLDSSDSSNSSNLVGRVEIQLVRHASARLVRPAPARGTSVPPGSPPQGTRAGQGPTARRKVTPARVEVVLQCCARAHEAGCLEDVPNSTAGHVAPIVLDREQTDL